jgi:hypothetical protein
MSHHLDSPLARQDPRLDITDLYVFRGQEGTVFALNVNSSSAGADAPQGFHPEAQYTIKLDLDGDAVEDLTYRFTFGERDGAEQQTVQLHRIAGRQAGDPTAVGTAVIEGVTGVTNPGSGGLRLWTGRARDSFSIDPTVRKAVGAAFKHGTQIDLSGWQPSAATNLFAGTTVQAIVLEVPDAELTWRLREVPSEVPAGDFTWRLRPEKRIHVWATTLLVTDTGSWRPINRVGHPMIQYIFHSDDGEAATQYNTTAPSEDLAVYGERFARQVAAVVAAHGSAANPQAYGEAVAALLLPDMLPYQLGTPANYGFAGHNGRALTDKVADVMFSLVTNLALSSGAFSSNRSDTARDSFPYVAALAT